MVSTRGRKDVLPSSSLSTLGDVLSQSLKRAREEEEEEAAREEEAKEEEVEDAIEDTSVDAQMVEDELGAGEPTGSSCTMRSEVGAAGLEEEEAQLRRQDTYRKLMVLAAGRSIVKSEYAQGNPTPSGSGVNSTSSGELQAGPTQGVKLEEPVASGTDGKRTPAMIAERRRVAEEIREEKLARKRQEERRALREATDLRYRTFANTQLGTFGFTLNTEGVTKYSSGSGGLGARGDPNGWKPDERCSDEQKSVLDHLKQGGNVFFTGSAGVGKSFLLQEYALILTHLLLRSPADAQIRITRMLEFLGRPFQVTATTGIAALQVSGATLHSFAGMGLGSEPIHHLLEHLGQVHLIERETMAGLTDGSRKETRKKWIQTQVLIIDEISMVDPVFFQKLNILAKLIRSDRRPFGGIQIVVSGDFFQLPPVPDKNPKCMLCGSEGLTRIPLETSTLSPEHPYETLRLPFPTSREFKDVVMDAEVFKCGERREKNKKTGQMEVVSAGCGWEGRERRFAFETETWAECRFKVMELTKVFRQSDVQYIRMLEKFRRGVCDQESINMLQTCGHGLADLGSIKPTNLYPIRSRVDDENSSQFRKLQEKKVVFDCQDASRGERARVAQKARLRDVPAVERLELKIGAQVMLLANVDIKQGLVNGSRGIIVDWKSASEPTESIEDPKKGKGKGSSGQGGGMGTEDWKEAAADDWKEAQPGGVLPVVCFASGATMVVQPWSWVIDIDRDNSVARTQMPLALAWALTIHKSQGQSLDAVGVKLSSTFERGQAYVALSRCRTPAGMQVEGFSPSHIMAHPTVTRFYTRIARSQPFLDESIPIPQLNPLAYFPPHYPFNGNMRQLFGNPPPPLPVGSALHKAWKGPRPPVPAPVPVPQLPQTPPHPKFIAQNAQASGSGSRHQGMDYIRILELAANAYLRAGERDHDSFTKKASEIFTRAQMDSRYRALDNTLLSPARFKPGRADDLAMKVEVEEVQMADGKQEIKQEMIEVKQEMFEVKQEVGEGSPKKGRKRARRVGG